MTLTADALTYNGLTIGAGPAWFDDGVEGLDMPDTTYQSTDASQAGVWGGKGLAGKRIVSASLWMDETSHEGFDLPALRRAMVLRPHPDDEIPLAWAGLGWPDGEYACWARPSKLRAITDEDATLERIRNGLDLQWDCADPVIYDHEATVVEWETSTTSDEFAVANAGMTLPFAARRTWALTLTGAGSGVVNPWMRVDHADGSWERIEWRVPVPAGSSLTVGPDLLPRVGSLVISGVVRSTSHLSPSAWSTVPLWWRLHFGDEESEANVVSVGCGGGAFTGSLSVRSGWL